MRQPVKECRKPCPQALIHLGKRGLATQCRQAGDCVIGKAAGHDAAKVGEIGRDIDRKAVKAHPAPDEDTYGGDLGLDLGSVDTAADPPGPRVWRNARTSKSP